MGGKLAIPESVKQLTTNKSASFKVDIADFAKDCIQLLYPNAKVSGQPTPQTTGWIEVTIIKDDGKTLLVHTKKGGDGPLTEKNIEGVMKKVIAFVEQ